MKLVQCERDYAANRPAANTGAQDAAGAAQGATRLLRELSDAATGGDAAGDAAELGSQCDPQCQDAVDLAYQSGCLRLGEKSDGQTFADICDKVEQLTHTHSPSGALRMPVTLLPLQVNFKAAAVAILCSGADAASGPTAFAGLASVAVILYLASVNR